jgi:branched-chain amino acid transport system ATP-binding protein
MTGIPVNVSATESFPIPAPPVETKHEAVARLACREVTVHFGGLVAVSQVCLAVPHARIVGLVGPNGAGKSTLFAVLSGLLRPERGKVFMDGEDLTGASPQARAARGLARTFQHPELFGGLTVRDHLVLAFRAKHVRHRVWSDLFTFGSFHRPSSEETDRVEELIELLALETLADRPALGLPLGSARLVELGRALASSPTVLLLDEPSSGLDSHETEQFEGTLQRVCDKQKTSILLVEHDVELVMRLCSTVNVLDFGVMIASGPPEEVRADPTVRSAYLGERLASQAGSSSGTRVAGGPGPEGRAVEVSDIADPVSAQERATAMTVEGLCVRYGDAVALHDVSFEVEAGRALCVLGPNGAGKSSLARAISGLVRPSAGRILLGGHDIAAWPSYRIRRAGVVHLPESRGVFRGLTVTENLRMAAGCLSGRARRKEAVDRALEIFPALAARRRQQASILSGGEQQMLSLARALATFPSLLIADEMSLGLAPQMVDLVFDGLLRARQEGVTVVMVEQYVHRALAFADECVVLQRGELVWRGRAKAAGNEVLRHYLGEGMVAAKERL